MWFPLRGVADAKKHAAFTIAVPATADTAAEVTIGYLVADSDKVRKFVCVDVSDIPGVKSGDIAVIIGRSGDECINASQLAEESGTITNEILSRMGARLKRTIAAKQGA